MLIKHVDVTKENLVDAMSLTNPEVLMVGYCEHVLGSPHFSEGEFNKIDVLDVGFPHRSDLRRVNVFTVFSRPYKTIIIHDKASNIVTNTILASVISRADEECEVFIHGDTATNRFNALLDSLTLSSFVSNHSGDYVARFVKSK